jgi:phosphatidylglycerophosphate synthase
MKKIMDWMLYISVFVTNPDFQWEQKWVQWLISKVYFVGPDIFTDYRFVGGYIAVEIAHYNMWLGIIVFLLGALTDWFDGKIVRYMEEFVPGWVHNKKIGAIRDGVADKFYIVFPLWDWGKSFFYHPLMYVYIFLAVTGYITIGYINWRRGDGEGRNVYEHLWIGKMKFALQIVLVCAVWAGKNFSPQWIWWPFWVNLTLGITTGLEFFSIARKIKPEFNRFSADAVSLGNLAYGLLAIYYAWRGKFFLAAASIIVGAIFDLADGYVARKTKGIESKIGKL